MPPVIDLETCNGCGRCEDSCPMNVIALDREKKTAFVRYPDECWHCGSCRQECPTGSLKIIFPLRMVLCSGGLPFSI